MVSIRKQSIIKHNIVTGQVDLSDIGKATWGNIIGDIADQSDLIEKIDEKIGDIVIPTKISELTNDSGYLTEHQSLEGYATENWVNSKNYLTEHQDISGKQDKLTSKQLANLNLDHSRYLTEHQSLEGYATENWVNSKNYLTEHQDISGKQDKLTDDQIANLNLDHSKYLTEHQSLDAYAKKTNYYTKTESDGKYQLQGDYITYNEMSEELADYAKSDAIPTLTSQLTNDSGYTTENWVNSNNYLTEHQDISGKQDKLTDGQIANLNLDHSKYLTSESATSIVKLTQTEYDALTTKDNSTIYLITEE